MHLLYDIQKQTDLTKLRRTTNEYFAFIYFLEYSTISEWKALRQTIPDTT